MKILYDYQALTMQKYGGVSRYFYEIISRLDKRQDCYVKLVAPFSVNYYFEDYFHKKSLNKFSSFEKQRWAERVNRVFTKAELKKKYDIIHPTYFDPYIIGRNSGKYVITIYDMIYEVYPEIFNKDIIGVMIDTKKQHIYNSDCIIAISEQTKKDILKFYPDVPEQKIKVIYLGHSLDTTKKDKDLDIDLPERYVLFIGQRGGYKNFNAFIKAMARIMKNDKTLHIVAGGGGKFSEEEKSMINELGLTDRVHQFFYNDDDLAAIYHKAICFVYPSMYEGFGIPILEAWVSECPIAISDASCFPEIAGDGAIYFDPLSIDSISEKIQLLINESKLRTELVQKDKKNIQKYSWDITAEQTLRLYKQLLINDNGDE